MAKGCTCTSICLVTYLVCNSYVFNRTLAFLPSTLWHPRGGDHCQHHTAWDHAWRHSCDGTPRGHPLPSPTHLPPPSPTAQGHHTCHYRYICWPTVWHRWVCNSVPLFYSCFLYAVSFCYLHMLILLCLICHVKCLEYLCSVTCVSLVLTYIVERQWGDLPSPHRCSEGHAGSQSWGQWGRGKTWPSIPLHPWQQWKNQQHCTTVWGEGRTPITQFEVREGHPLHSLRWGKDTHYTVSGEGRTPITQFEVREGHPLDVLTLDSVL